MNAILLSTALLGTIYQVQWPDGQMGVVNTETDRMKTTDREWEAAENGEWIWNPMGFAVRELRLFDVPDDWDGTMEGWAWVSQGTVASEGETWEAIGCWGSGWTESRDYGVGGYIQRCQSRWIESGMGMAFVGGEDLGWVNMTPVSPSRTIGDVNLDGRFNTSDLVLVLQHGKYETGEPALWADGDWTGDGLFGTADLVLALQAGQYEQPNTLLVPEPASVWFFSLGVCSLFLMRKGNDDRRKTWMEHD